MASAFEELGLPDTATPSEVKLKWRQLCREHHPDKGGNAVTFTTLHRAYEIAYAEAIKPKICPECNGSGKISRSRGFNSINMPCAVCHESGWLKVAE